MSPRNPLHFAEILVCLDGSSYSQAAVEYAAQIALEHNASLTGIGVIDLPGIQRSIGITSNTNRATPWIEFSITG